MSSEIKGRNKSRRQEPLVSEAEIKEQTSEVIIAPKEKKPLIPKDIDPNQRVIVYNGFQGKLVYKSRRTGEPYVWEYFGGDQEMELLELKNAKNLSKKYFEKNWFMFDEAWIPEYLGVSQFYKFAIPIDEFDALFEKSADEIEEILGKVSDGQKRSIGYRARQLVAQGAIDSNKIIATLEKCLGVELIERFD